MAHRYIKRKYKNMLHISNGNNPMWLVRCGAYTYQGQGGRYNSRLEIVAPRDIKKYHHCLKCFDSAHDDRS